MALATCRRIPLGLDVVNPVTIRASRAPIAQRQHSKSPNSRRQLGCRMLLLPAVLHAIAVERVKAEEQGDEEAEEDSSAEEWDEFQGDGFLLRVPPGFEDTIEPDDYPRGEKPMYGYQPKQKLFAARFATPDREESVSVVVRRASLLKPTFFETKSITDLGDVKDTAKLFLPVGGRLTGLSSVTSDSRVYYLYEYRVAEKHFFLSTAATNGQVFVAIATAPEVRWEKHGDLLRSAAASFSLR